jgi:hypothetical protein
MSRIKVTPGSGNVFAGPQIDGCDVVVTRSVTGLRTIDSDLPRVEA